MSYESDFYAWTQEQATALRKAASLRINLPSVDLEHLAEEIEDMGNDTLEKIEGLVLQIIAHLLKLEFSPDEAPRRHWRSEVSEWRSTVRRRAKRSPTAMNRLDIAELTADATEMLRLRYSGEAWTRDLPDRPSHTIAQITDRAFFPENRHGLTDG